LTIESLDKLAHTALTTDINLKQPVLESWWTSIEERSSSKETEYRALVRGAKWIKI